MFEFFPQVYVGLIFPGVFRDLESVCPFGVAQEAPDAVITTARLHHQVLINVIVVPVKEARVTVT